MAWSSKDSAQSCWYVYKVSSKEQVWSLLKLAQCWLLGLKSCVFGGCSLCFTWMLVQGGELLGCDQNPYESLFCYFFVLSSAYIRQGCSVFLRNKLSLVYCVIKSFLFFPTMDIDLLKVNHVNLFMCSFSFFLSFTLLQNSVCMA